MNAINYRQLEIFHAIMTTGSVTAAAGALNLSQPAVTKILRSTEERLGFFLFHRVGGRMVPSDDALVILHDVERLLQDMSSVNQTIVNVRLGRSGALNIVGVPPMCQVIIPKAIAKFAQERPEVQISFAQRDGNVVMQYVASQRADVGLSFLVPLHSSVDSTTLSERDMVCIVPRGHHLADRSCVTVADLEHEPLISYPQDSRLQPLISTAFTSSKSEVPRRIQATSIVTTWALVQQGAGIGIVENISRLNELYDNIVVVPFQPSISVRLDCITPRTKPPSRLAQQFIQTVLEMLAE